MLLILQVFTDLDRLTGYPGCKEHASLVNQPCVLWIKKNMAEEHACLAYKVEPLLKDLSERLP